MHTYTSLLGFIPGRVIKNSAKPKFPCLCARSRVFSSVMYLKSMLPSLLNTSLILLFTSHTALRLARGRKDRMCSTISQGSSSMLSIAICTAADLLSPDKDCTRSNSWLTVSQIAQSYCCFLVQLK